MIDTLILVAIIVVYMIIGYKMFEIGSFYLKKKFPAIRLNQKQTLAFMTVFVFLWLPLLIFTLLDIAKDTIKERFFHK